MLKAMILAHSYTYDEFRFCEVMFCFLFNLYDYADISGNKTYLLLRRNDAQWL